MSPARGLLLALLISFPASLLLADDLTGAKQLLCTPVQATACDEDGECEIDLPWKFNVPQFVVVDLAAKKLGTTGKSDDQRESPIQSLTRDGATIVIQGLEQGRAYSFVINEKSGRMTGAIARDGGSMTMLGGCTVK